METLRPAIALSKLDFPTLGLPIMAIFGMCIGFMFLGGNPNQIRGFQEIPLHGKSPQEAPELED
jgi:hypothetical protein